MKLAPHLKARQLVSPAALRTIGLVYLFTLGFSTSLLSCSPRPNQPIAPSAAQHQGPPTAAQRAKLLVSKMTLDEKLAYIGGDRDFYIRPIERLKIPEIKMADGPVGCRNWGPSTAYPASIGLAASFDPQLTYEVGHSLARDCRARGVHILLAPGTNIQRSPLNGRNFEYLGEDPYLARDHAVGFIKGVQGGGVMATVKHFVANNQEWDRHHVSSEVSERALNEIYFPAFEGAVKIAHVGAVMSSYNLLNGTYASQNSFLLRDTLRKRWGFDGLVMSDWSAVYSGLQAVKGGLDLEMPHAAAMNADELRKLLAEGKIQESEIDEKVFHILRTLVHFGFLDRPQLLAQPVDDPKSASIALAAAQKSVVLLKNETILTRDLGSNYGFLPVDPSTLKKIVVVGPNASPAVHGGSGSAYTTPTHAVSLLEGIRAMAPGAAVFHHQGITQETGFGTLGAAVFAGPVKQEIFLGKRLEGPAVYTSEVNQINMQADGNPPAPNVPAENYSIRWSGTVKVTTADIYQLMTNADDGVRVFLDEGLMINDFTDHAPRMKQVELSLKPGEHRIVVEYFQGTLGSICQFGFGKKVQPGKLLGETELIRLVKDADLVVLAVGYGQNAETNSMGTAFTAFWPPEWARKGAIVEAEDDDRQFSLPKPQVATILAVTRNNRNTVVVGFSGGGVEFEPWLDTVPALLWAWYPGQEGGTALAQTIFGQINPSARLPVTFAKKYEDYPSASSYGLRLPLEKQEKNGKKANLTGCITLAKGSSETVHDRRERGEGPLYLSPYCEDIFVGYRGFDHSDTEPLFPFGHGLSYTTFNYANLTTTETSDGKIKASIILANTGTRPGSEVVQFYVAPLTNGAPSSLERAPQQLAGYMALELQPGQEKLVELELNPRAFAVYQSEKGGWTIPKGAYEIRASRSSRNHQLHTIINLQSTRATP